MQQATASFPLSRFVESVREIAPSGGRRRVDRLPDGRTCLVFRSLQPGHGDIFVIGPRTRAVFKEVHGFVAATTVQFKPGWSTPLLGVAASVLTDRYVRLEDLWGGPGRELLFELLAAEGATVRLERIAKALARRVHPASEPTSAPLARRAAQLLDEADVRVERVADRLGVTARHLRRAFAENIGVTPKDYARSARLQRVVRMAATAGDWSKVASTAGYYDQAHLIAEFRDLVGLTPGAFARRGDESRREV